jgi:SAM-dependent methyltransferase
MSITSATPTSAERNGAHWGARARDWAAVEAQQVPTYEAAIRGAGIRAGHVVLDAGCGTGVFLRAAADRGAIVCGLDASQGLLEIARGRVPEADLSQGDLLHLPYVDDAFDAVTGFNSFFFADDMVAALREAGRVAKPGAPIVIQVWGRPDRFDLGLMKDALARFTPPPPPGRLNPTELWRHGALEELAMQAGLVPDHAFDVRWAFEFDSEDAMTRGMMSAGGFDAIVGAEREAARAAIVEALEGCRTPEGGYRLENEWHFLIARAAR